MEKINVLLEQISKIESKQKLLIGVFFLSTLFIGFTILALISNEKLNSGIYVFIGFIIFELFIVIYAGTLTEQRNNIKEEIADIAIEENYKVILNGQYVMPLGINFSNYDIEIKDDIIILKEKAKR